MRRLALLLLAACGGADAPTDDTDPADSDVDTEVVESDPPDSDPFHETDVVDTVVPDTDLPPGCSPDVPDGPCPGVATCVEGRCLVDFDPGDPVPTGAVDDWDTIAAYIGTRSLLPSPVDWTAASADGHAAVAAATTHFGAAWAMMRAVERLQDGHTLLRPDVICRNDQGFTSRQSSVGACVVEASGELVVHQALPSSSLRPGDVLLAIDGRSAEELVLDRLAQPRCGGWASTDAARREAAVASLLMRPQGERRARVRRDGVERVVSLSNGQMTSCSPRLPVTGDAALIGRARTATLPGGVALVVLPEMGAMIGTDFVDGPVIDALRGFLEDLPPGTPLVFDLRGNAGGSMAIPARIGAWLLPTGTELWRCRSRVGDAIDAVGSLIPELAVADALELTGKVAVVTDAGTAGAGEFLPWALQQNGRGVIVGASTHGTYGIVRPVPGGSAWGAMLNSLRCEREDGTVLDGHPPPPDVAVVLDPADAARGVDTVLEAARQAVLAP